MVMATCAAPGHKRRRRSSKCEVRPLEPARVRRLEDRGQDRLVAGVVKQLGHCAGPRLSPRSGPVVGCSPAPGLRRGRLLKIGQTGGFEAQAWLILRTRAHIRIAWATPTRPLRSGAARHLPARSAAIVRSGPGGVPNQVVDNGAFTGRMGYAHPTAAPGDRLDPSQGLRP